MSRRRARPILLSESGRNALAIILTLIAATACAFAFCGGSPC